MKNKMKTKAESSTYTGGHPRSLLKMIVSAIADIGILLMGAQMIHLSFMAMGSTVLGFARELVHAGGTLILIGWVLGYSVFLSFSSPISIWKKA